MDNYPGMTLCMKTFLLPESHHVHHTLLIRTDRLSLLVHHNRTDLKATGHQIQTDQEIAPPILVALRLNLRRIINQVIAAGLHREEQSGRLMAPAIEHRQEAVLRPKNKANKPKKAKTRNKNQYPFLSVKNGYFYSIEDSSLPLLYPITETLSVHQ